MLLAADLIQQATQVASFWAPEWCGPSTLRQIVTDTVDRLYREALRWDTNYRKQRFQLFVVPSGNNAVGVAGPGVGGFGMDGSRVALEGTTGQAQGFDFNHATLLIVPTIVSSATSTTLTLIGAGWTVNAFIGRLVAIVAGPGTPQYRRVASNTSDTLTVLAWTTIPTSGSLFALYDVPDSAQELTGLLLTIPATRHTIGFVTKLDAQGNPYLDLSAPLVGSYRSPIQLPPVQRVLDATRWPTTITDRPQPMTIVNAGQRDLITIGAALALVGDTVIPVGELGDWTGIQSVELGVIPVPPAITRDADILFLGEPWRLALVSEAARAIAERGIGVNACSELTYDRLERRAGRDLESVLSSVRGNGQARVLYDVQVL